MSSLKTNIFFNYINTITGIVFPVITFPYAARILMAEGLGIVNFQLSVINYIVLFTSLGIPMYAVREVAKYRDDPRLRNSVTVEMVLLSMGLCLLGYVGVWVLGEYVPIIHRQLSLFYLLSLTVLFTALGVQWFYQGIEDFRFITMRALAIRTLSALSLFIFVRTPDDLLIYGLVVVGSTVGNNLVNFIHLRKYISFSSVEWGELRVLRHLRPALRIFVLNLVISIYVNLNTVMLGFMQGEGAVGLYTAGVKMSHVALSVITSLGVVMLPRCSNLVEAGKMSEFASVSRKAMRLVFALSLPLAVGLMLLADPVISVFCGSGFSGSVPVLCWTAPIVFIVGITNVIGIQILYPQNRENIVIWSTVGGAVINLLLNIPLILLLSHEGAAIATFFAEGMVLAVQLVLGRRHIPFRLWDSSFTSYVTGTLGMACAVWAIRCLVHVEWVQVILSLLVGGSVYAAWLLYRRDEMLSEVMCHVFNKK